MENFKHITIENAKQLINAGNATLVDIRDVDSFKSSHIEGAVHLSNDNVQQFVQESNLDKPLIVYCYHGHSSQPAAQFLFEQGFDDVYSLIGGYTAWASGNHP